MRRYNIIARTRKNIVAPHYKLCVLDKRYNIFGSREPNPECSSGDVIVDIRLMSNKRLMHKLYLV